MVASRSEPRVSPGSQCGGVAQEKTEGRARARVPLSRKRIVEAALKLVEDHGLPGFTTRRLGTALGCEAMSIYHHFPSKRHLHEAMVEHAVAEIGEPPADLDPIERLRFLGREYRAMAHRYPRLFQFIALHRLDMPAGVAFIERFLRHFHAAVPDDRLAAQAFRVFGYYVLGAALDETSGYAERPSAAVPVRNEYVARECRLHATAAPFFKRPYYDSTFDLGFEFMLKGIADLRAPPPANPRPAPKPVVRPKAQSVAAARRNRMR